MASEVSEPRTDSYFANCGFSGSHCMAFGILCHNVAPDIARLTLVHFPVPSSRDHNAITMLSSILFQLYAPHLLHAVLPSHLSLKDLQERNYYISNKTLSTLSS